MEKPGLGRAARSGLSIPRIVSLLAMAGDHTTRIPRAKEDRSSGIRKRYGYSARA